ncbi:MAG TPA: multicopper oxidase domain-containing protein, partial [Nitrososphaeraceae archaeon]|nr:multicopper oxidase domain-containing protein [Nitrososphaeraceae archaeon]
MSNQTNSNSNNKIKLFTLALCAIVVIISIGTSLVVYTLAQSNNNDMSSKLNPDKNAYNTTIPLIREASNPNRQITLVAEDAEIEIAPGKRVKTWTFNGTVPAPTIRLTEGENVTIKFINKSPIPHTIHFHGNHDDTADGVLPQVMPNQTYLYNITGEPAGALMYHCHAPPTSLHIRMGMYGALIVDPKDKPLLLPPAKELVMVMSEYDLEDQLGGFEADYYLINGYADQYLRNPITINHGELLRMYIINIGTTIPAPFHLHSTTFMAYPSGLLDNEPQHVQTIPIAPGDASIIEAKWKYPGTYLFHAHGIQEERGNMGQINVIGTSGTSYGDKNVVEDSGGGGGMH